jgi:hypothetical protein
MTKYEKLQTIDAGEDTPASTTMKSCEATDKDGIYQEILRFGD